MRKKKKQKTKTFFKKLPSARNIGLFFALSLFIFGTAVSVWYILHQSRRYHILQQDGITAEGKIVNLEVEHYTPRGGHDHVHYYPIVVFTDKKGIQHQFISRHYTHDLFGVRFWTGDSVLIIYSEKQPEIAEIKAVYDDGPIGVYAGIFMLVYCFIFFVVLWLAYTPPVRERCHNVNVKRETLFPAR